MTEAVTDVPEKKSSKLPMLIGLILALAGGGGAFFAVYSGMILGSDDAHATTEAHGDADPHQTPISVGAHVDASGVVFVPVDPLVISLGPGSSSRHLQFRAQLEVAPEHEEQVRKMMPRVVDVLNGYLRAVETADFENPAVLPRLRAQMLRRIQVVVGQAAVRDVLIMEFVLN